MAAPRLCSMPECNKVLYARGWCQPHYWRWKRHGSPTGGGTRPGAAMAHLAQTVIPYDGEECLIWPFHRNQYGYGIVWQDGRLHVVSRLVCEVMNGPPPLPKLDAAHSCGNGSKGCVSKRHLSWKTRAANTADRIAHGTANRGERHNWTKLTELQVREIRTLVGQQSRRAIARHFSVSPATIFAIERGDSWAWLI